ncbi:MAG: hypothetical protein ABI640_20495 [Gammaproteobacteria bacterium]
MLQSVEEFVRTGTERALALVDLAAAEVRLAALSGLTMLLLVMIASAALVVAWALVVGCLLYLLSRTGIGWPIPAFLLAVAHVALAYTLWQITVRLSKNLSLPELRRTAFAAQFDPQETNADEATALVPDGP